MKLRFCAMAVPSVLLGICNVSHAEPAASFTGGPTTVGHAGNSATTLGWVFSSNTTVTVTALGYYDDGSNGLAEVHDVGIFSSTGSLLFSTTIPAGNSGALIAGFRYVSIAPVVLSIGNYTIAGTIGAQASDPVAYNVAGLSSAAQITIPSGASRYTESGSYTSLTYPTLAFPSSNPYNVYFGPNFQVSPVPEPSTVVFMGVGALGLLAAQRRRVTVA